VQERTVAVQKTARSVRIKGDSSTEGDSSIGREKAKFVTGNVTEGAHRRTKISMSLP
jgi:hypothetical protein